MCEGFINDECRDGITVSGNGADGSLATDRPTSPSLASVNVRGGDAGDGDPSPATSHPYRRGV